MQTTISRILVGGPQELVPGEQSAIWKEPVSGPVAAGPGGLDGDAHVYHAHGGGDKAILHYAAESYHRVSPSAAAGLPDRTLFGENILTLGMTEADVCIGDVFLLGRDVLAQVTQARQPCWKLGVTTRDPGVPKRMQDTATTGWFYKILKPGQITAGDSIVLQERPNPGWSVERSIRVFYGDPLNQAALKDLAALAELGDEWKRVIAGRLATGRVEPWDARLYNGV